MKKFLFLFFIFFVGPALAFFPQPDFEREEKKVHIGASEDYLHVEILERIKNPTSETQKIQLFESLPGNATEVQFFVDAQGESFEVLAGSSMLEGIFENAKKYEDTRFFRFTPGKDLDSRLIFASSELEVPAEKTIFTKITFDAKPERIQEFFAADLWFYDEIFTGKSEMAINVRSDRPIYHFFTNLPSGGITQKSENGITFLFQADNFLPNENINFFWSETEKSMLNFPLLGENYLAHIFYPPPQKEIEEITFLIDRSGSLYGAPWDRVRDYVNFWLEQLPTETRVRIVFFDTETEIFKDFSENSVEFREEVFNYLKNMHPYGKTDLTESIEKIKEGWQVPAENRAVILLTDYDEDIDGRLADILSASLVVLDISAAKNRPLEILAKKSGGFYQKLFRSPWKLIEEGELWDKWANWRKTKTANEVTVQPSERDILPGKIDLAGEGGIPIFVGRIAVGDLLSGEEKISFFPRMWAARRLAEIMHQLTPEISRGLTRRELETELLDAFLAIGRTFGVKTSFSDENTYRTQLQKNLIKAGKEELEWESMKLEDPSIFSFPTNARFWKGVSFYWVESDEVWRQFDFLDRAKLVTEIAPFSEAQRRLFLTFPEILGQGFGIGHQVEFCITFRCFSIKAGNREVFQYSDLAFLRDFDPGHWANEYLIELVKKAILKPEINGKLHPNRPIDRGEFVQMVVEYLWGKDFVRSQTSLNFSDMADSEFAETVNFLVQKSVIRGYTDGTFRPLQSLTRAEAVKILLASQNFAPFDDPDEEAQFPDATGWEKYWVNEAVRRGIVKGFPDGTFRPHQKLTKAEAAKLIVETGK